MGILDSQIGRVAGAHRRCETGGLGSPQRKESPNSSVGLVAWGSEAAWSRKRRPPSRASRRQDDGRMRRSPILRQTDNQAARLTKWFDGVLGGLLLLRAAARHERGDGEGVGPGGELWLGRRRELHGAQCAVLATHGACRAPVQLPHGRQTPTPSAKFPSAISAESETPDESAPTGRQLHTGLCPSLQSPPAADTSK